MRYAVLLYRPTFVARASSRQLSAAAAIAPVLPFRFRSAFQSLWSSAMTPRLSCCLLLLPLTLSVAPAFAVDAPETPASSQPSTNSPTETAADASGGSPLDETKIQQVVVTSQKRAQDVQEIPLSVSVVGREQLQAQRIADFDDLSRSVPAVSFNSVGASEGETNVTIRGVSSTSGSATVGLYLDDVSITTKNFYDYASQPRFFDLQSIEVLRGPQGSLWGASSEGGTIRFIPVEPNMAAFSGEATADVSETQHGGENKSASAMLNVPVNPGVFAVRGSVCSTSDSGWIDNYTQQGVLAHSGVNSEDATAIHVLGKLTPNDDLTIKAAYFRQDNNTHDNSAFYPDMGLFEQDKQVREFGSDGMSLGSLSIQNDFHAFELSSVTGVFHRGVKRQEDGTYYNSTLFAEAFLDPLYPQNQAQNDSIIGNLASPVEMDTDYRQLSQEFRISSPENQKSALKWVAGIYFADQVIHNTDFQTIPGINTAFQSIYGIPMEQSLVQSAYGAPGIQLFPGNIDEYDDRTYREKQTALFGQLDYDLRADWHVGVGARFVKAEEDFESKEVGFYQIGNISPYNQAASFTAFTPKVTVSHDIDASDQMYASAGEGFRLGGPTGPIVFGPTSVCAGDFAAIGQTTQPTSFKSDSLWTYEFGSKNILADNRLMFDSAVFYTDWKNIQQQLYLPTCGYYFTSNVGNAGILGGELEATAKVTRAFHVNMSVSAEHATITSSSNTSAVPVGAHLIDVPGLTVTLGESYTIDLGDGSNLITRANYAWTGHSYGSYQVGNANYYNPGYGVLNLNISLTHKTYDVSLYAKNALNNQTIIQSPEINTVVEGYTVRPRTVGLTGTFRF
jgi:outer membrane receptor protein involved in Fe transport